MPATRSIIHTHSSLNIGLRDTADAQLVADGRAKGALVYCH